MTILIYVQDIQCVPVMLSVAVCESVTGIVSPHSLQPVRGDTREEGREVGGQVSVSVAEGVRQHSRQGLVRGDR